MSEETADLPPDFPGFPDLAALKTAHARLVQRPQGEAATEDFLKDVEGFVIRAQATGRILGDEDDRTAAQNVIDYWVTVLLRGRRTPPETGLAEFGFPAPRGSLRNQPVQEYLAEQRMAIRRRLGLSAAAAQWQDGGRERALLWGGRELWSAADYEDLSQLERQFIAASQANERRAALFRGLVIAAAVVLVAIIVALIITGLVVQKREAVANSQLMQHQVAKTLVERAAVLMRDGDVSGSLLWLAQALLEDREAQYDEKIHRIRLGAAITQLPKLHHALLEERSTYFCNSAKFNADGSLVLTISNPKQAGEGVVRLWDAATGKKLADFPETKAKVNDAGFCADGRILIASGDPGGGPGQVRLWQKDGQASTEFDEGAVLSATMSPQGDRVALLFDGKGDQPAVLEVRRISDGMSLTGPLEWPGEIHDVKFSPDGNYVAAGGAIKELLPGLPPKNTGQVKVWDAWKGAPLNLDMRSDLPVDCLAFAPDDPREKPEGWERPSCDWLRRTRRRAWHGGRLEDIHRPGVLHHGPP
jgi:hypothetical protein